MYVYILSRIMSTAIEMFTKIVYKKIKNKIG